MLSFDYHHLHVRTSAQLNTNISSKPLCSGFLMHPYDLVFVSVNQLKKLASHPDYCQDKSISRAYFQVLVMFAQFPSNSQGTVILDYLVSNSTKLAHHKNSACLFLEYLKMKSPKASWSWSYSYLWTYSFTFN